MFIEYIYQYLKLSTRTKIMNFFKLEDKIF